MAKDGKPTVYDIARIACVSVATVSRVLNHHRGVRAATAERINQIIESTGFRPRWHSKANQIVGFLLPPYQGCLQGSFLRTLVASCYSSLREAGFSLQLLWRSIYHENRPFKARIGSFESLAGIIVVSCPPDYEFDRQLLEASHAFPCVVIGRLDEGSASAFPHNIISDDFQAGDELARLLLRYNHRSFCLVSASQKDYGHAQRLAGMLTALREAGIRPEKIRCLEFRDNLKSRGRKLAFDLAADRMPPEAVLFTDSLICSGFAMGCHDAKLDIPRTLSVAGFEDDTELESLPQSITSVRISAEELGRQAVRSLLAQCLRQAEPLPKVTMHTLQVGGSIQMR